MQFDLASLEHQLNTKLETFYLLTSPDAFFVHHARKMIWGTAQAHGFTHRQVFGITSQTDWEAIKTLPVLSDLFDRPCIELCCQQILDSNTGKAMIRLVESFKQKALSPLLIISFEQSTYKLQQTKWFQQLGSLSTVITIPAVSKQQLPYQLKAELKRRGLSVTRKAMGLFAEAVQGNTAAAFQVIEKLSLIYPEADTPLDATQVSELLAQADATFELYEFTQAIVKQEVPLCLKTLSYLEHQQVAPVLVLGYLSRLVRTVVLIKSTLDNKDSLQEVFQKYQVWKKDQAGFVKLAEKLTTTQIRELVDCIYQTELSAKGVEGLSAWHYLRHISLLLIGHPIRVPVSSRRY